ncbi:hypothetical protein C0J52_28257 [Blattella germanica]|nr:hypothetical protein C0J52_28257 [Blattella germanica]
MNMTSDVQKHIKILEVHRNIGLLFKAYFFTKHTKFNYLTKNSSLYINYFKCSA